MSDFARLTREEQNERIIAEQCRDVIALKKRIAELEEAQVSTHSSDGSGDREGSAMLASSCRIIGVAELIGEDGLTPSKRRIAELEGMLTEWRDWYRMAFGTDYTAQGIVGRTDKILKR